MRATRPTLAIAILVLVALAVGCASTQPRAAEAIGAADYALRKAKEDGASQHASGIVRQAEDKLDRARTARAEGDYSTAARLADEVALEAQVAEATSRNKRLHEAKDEIQATVDALQAELQRNVERAR